jgi:SAM-dependent methyltransferase
MLVPATIRYPARTGYCTVDATRYERRRYRGLRRRLNLWWLERALGRVLGGVDARRPVLDLPCGTGILGGFLAARGFRVVGADISPPMLAVARDRAPGIGLVRADLEAPPWRRRAFAAVVCSRFLMHLPAVERPRVLRALADLTDGPLIATVCHPYTLKSATRALRRGLGWDVKRSPRLTRAELEAEARAAGLRVERVTALAPLVSEVWVVVMRDDEKAGS